MSSQDNLERALRDIHVMISKSEAYGTDRIIINKQDMFNLIDRLNASVYEIMDEYELTQQSRDKALREKKKEGDKLIWDASRQAEDIYAASVMYTDEAMNHLGELVGDARAEISRMYKDFLEDMKRQQETIRENQLELKSQLQLLVDEEKYLRLIEERNKEIEREKAAAKGKKVVQQPEESPYAGLKPKIKINEAYFQKAGIPLEDGRAAEDVPEEMEMLPDEGVIESTLKKAPQDVPETVDPDGVAIEDLSMVVQLAEEASQQRSAEERTAFEEQLKADRRMDGEETSDGSALVLDIHVNPNAEYFQWKKNQANEGTDEADDTEFVPEPEKPRFLEQGEKISLFDKLMGKKK